MGGHLSKKTVKMLKVYWVSHMVKDLDSVMSFIKAETSQMVYFLPLYPFVFSVSLLKIKVEEILTLH